MCEKNLFQLLKELKVASKECWDAKVAIHETAVSHAPLCLEILERLGYVPELINGRIETRQHETDGRDVLQHDFWNDADMIIALAEHLEEEYWSLEGLKYASA